MLQRGSLEPSRKPLVRTSSHAPLSPNLPKRTVLLRVRRLREGGIFIHVRTAGLGCDSDGDQGGFTWLFRWSRRRCRCWVNARGRDEWPKVKVKVEPIGEEFAKVEVEVVGGEVVKVITVREEGFEVKVVGDVGLEFIRDRVIEGVFESFEILG